MTDLIKLLRGYRIDARHPEEVMRQAADEIERLRGLLLKIRSQLAPGFWATKLGNEIDAALAGATIQPSALPERCSVCGGAHDVGNPCRATSPTDAAP